MESSRLLCTHATRCASRDRRVAASPFADPGPSCDMAPRAPRAIRASIHASPTTRQSSGVQESPTARREPAGAPPGASLVPRALKRPRSNRAGAPGLPQISRAVAGLRALERSRATPPSHRRRHLCMRKTRSDPGRLAACSSFLITKVTISRQLHPAPIRLQTPCNRRSPRNATNLLSPLPPFSMSPALSSRLRGGDYTRRISSWRPPPEKVSTGAEKNA